jgi:hypothetical protein
VIQQYNEAEIEDLEPGPAQQIAAMSLSTLMVRSAGSGLVLISGGYVPESAAPIRRCVEANLRIGAVLEDPSGKHARAWLKGQPLGTVGKLAHKYGKTEDLKLLSIYAHSDVRGLAPLLTGPPHAKDHISTSGRIVMIRQPHRCSTPSRTNARSCASISAWLFTFGWSCRPGSIPSLLDSRM